MIFKLQRPVSSKSKEEPPYLVYNEGRSIVALVPRSRELDALLAGAPKVFVHALHRPDGTFAWGEPAPWQDW